MMPSVMPPPVVALWIVVDVPVRIVIDVSMGIIMVRVPGPPVCVIDSHVDPRRCG
jgi:hypothetical protein